MHRLAKHFSLTLKRAALKPQEGPWDLVAANAVAMMQEKQWTRGFCNG